MRLFKKITLLLGICMTMSVVAPVSAYAGNEQVDALIEEAKTIEQEGDSGTKRDRIVELLKEKLDDSSDPIGDDPTVKGGYKIIEEILKDEKVDLSNFSSGLRLAWEKAFKEEAMSLGVNFESVYSTYVDDSGNVVTSKDEEAGKSDAENAGVKTNILTWNTTTDSTGSALSKANQGMVSKLLTSVSEALPTFTDNIRAFSVALAITFGAIGMMNMIQDKSASNEMLSREFIKLLIGVWFIYNYKFFALLIIRAGTLVVEGVMTGVGNASGNAVKYALVKSFVSVLQNNQIDEISNNVALGIFQSVADVGSSLSGVFGSITSLFGNGLIQLASSLVIYSVVIEIAVRYVLTPLAIADLYSEKWRSNGWMWLKKLFAASIQGAVIFLIIYVTDLFKSGLDASYSVITNTAINLTMIGMFAKSRQIANDIIGVH